MFVVVSQAKEEKKRKEREKLAKIKVHSSKNVCGSVFGVFGFLLTPAPPQTNMTMENPRYFLLNMGISQCHVSFHSGVYFWWKLGKCHVLPGDSKDKITSVIIAV